MILCDINFPAQEMSAIINARENSFTQNHTSGTLLKQPSLLNSGRSVNGIEGVKY